MKLSRNFYWCGHTPKQVMMSVQVTVIYVGNSRNNFKQNSYFINDQRIQYVDIQYCYQYLCSPSFNFSLVMKSPSSRHLLLSGPVNFLEGKLPSTVYAPLLYMISAHPSHQVSLLYFALPPLLDFLKKFPGEIVFYIVMPEPQSKYLVKIFMVYCVLFSCIIKKKIGNHDGCHESSPCHLPGYILSKVPLSGPHGLAVCAVVSLCIIDICSFGRQRRTQLASYL